MGREFVCKELGMRDSEMDRGMIFLKEFHILHHLFLQEAYKEGQPLGGEEFERFIERLRGTLGIGVQLPPNLVTFPM